MFRERNITVVIKVLYANLMSILFWAQFTR